jgi:hypothetical protein
MGGWVIMHGQEEESNCGCHINKEIASKYYADKTPSPFIWVAQLFTSFSTGTDGKYEG